MCIDSQNVDTMSMWIKTSMVQSAIKSTWLFVSHLHNESSLDPYKILTLCSYHMQCQA
jgi:hypothetical protein